MHLLQVPKEDTRDLSQFDSCVGEVLADFLCTIRRLIENLDLHERG
jgi:hypothetical protein